MAANNTSDDEIKARVRALEDRKEVRLQMKIEKSSLQTGIASYTDMIKAEFNHNNNLKKQLYQLKNINEREKQKHEALSAIRSILANGNLNKVLSFSEAQIENYKKSNIMKQADFEKKLQEHIVKYIQQRPLVEQYERNEAHLAQLERQISSVREERGRFAQEMRKEEQINELLFQQNIVDMAYHAVRYYNLVEQARNPNKKIAKPVSLKPIAKLKMHKSGLNMSFEHQQVMNEKHTNDQHVLVSSSVDPEMLSASTNGDHNIDLDSRGRGGTEVAKRHSSNEVPFEKPSNDSTLPPFLDKRNVNDKYGKLPILSVSSPKVSTLYSFQKRIIAKKVTFAGTEPSKIFNFDRNRDVSSSKANLVAAMDMSMENENEVQMSENDENDVQMSDDGIDKISNSTSLEASATVERKPTSWTTMMNDFSVFFH